MTSRSSSPSPERYEGGGDESDPSSSRSRTEAANGGVWPENLVEALALRVAIDASRDIGRLAAGVAVANVFQVCSTWRAVSRSDRLWKTLTNRIWNHRRRSRHTWRQEYIFRHQTAVNFRNGKFTYTNIRLTPPHKNNGLLPCRRLAVSDCHVAAGYSDGSVRLFSIANGCQLHHWCHVSTFRAHYRNRLGQFSGAVSGIILSEVRLVFASLDGDVHVAVIGEMGPPRRAHLGDVVNDGALVDFSGCYRWWVGLYAGVPGRAFHVWNGESEELIFIGGTLTDPEAVMGWHLLTEPVSEPVGRVRINYPDSAIACTSQRLIAFNLRNQGLIIGEQDFPIGLNVGSFDSNDDAFLILDRGGSMSVHRPRDLVEERWRLSNVGGIDSLACMNGGYVIMCVRGVIRVFDVMSGIYLYWIRGIGDLHVFVANDRYVVGCTNDDDIIHLWDFGAQ